MSAVVIPDLPARRGWRGIILDQHVVAGEVLHAVTVKTEPYRPARRTWFTDRAAALVHALELADMHEIMVFDLCDPEAGL